MKPFNDSLELPESGLGIQDGFFCRWSKQGTTIAEHPLKDLVGIQVVRELVLMPLIGGAGFAALAAVAVMFIDSQFWGWSAAVVFTFFALTMWLTVWRRFLELRFADGKVRYELCDPPGDCDGFLMSLAPRIQEAKEQPAPARKGRR